MPTIAKCGLCPATARPGVVYGPILVAGKPVEVCHYHFRNPTEKTERTDVSELKKVAADKKLTQKVWFDLKLKNAPKTCECGCKGKLSVPDGMSPRTNVAHIFPKAVFKSVATHPDNYWYATWQHHTDFDNATWPEKMKLPIWGIIQGRVYSVIQDMAEGELKHLPGELRAMRNQTVKA